jgi:phosphopantetheine adenylyltransferase
MSNDDTYGEYLHNTLVDNIQRLNETKAGKKAIEAVLAEFGFEKMTVAKLDELKKEAGL